MKKYEKEIFDYLDEERERLLTIYDYLADDSKINDKFMFEYYKKKSDRLQNCHKYHSCNVRLCPICDYLKNRKAGKNLKKIINYMPSSKFIFITLTIGNCLDEDLEDMLHLIFEAWNRLVGYKRIKNSITGWFRWLEVTYNEETQSYHPHFHIIACTHKNYFSDNSIYISKDDLQRFWKKATRSDYKPSIQITKVYSKNVCNYVSRLKPREYLFNDDISISKQVIKTLDKVLFNCRVRAYGGIMKEMSKELKEIKN